MAHHPPVDSCSIFTSSLMKQFMRGLARLHPSVRRPTPSWDLSLVLEYPCSKPFEPMVTCPLHLLSWKTGFVVVITSAQWVGELHVLCHDPPYLTVHMEGVTLFLDISSLPKVASTFRLWSTTQLCTFFLYPRTEECSLHALDVQWAFLFYQSHTKS